MNTNNMIDWLAVILVLIGSINWVLSGIFSFNLVTTVSVGIEIVEQLIYVLVALSAIYLVYVKVSTK